MFAPDARLFETTKGQVGIGHIVRIDPDCVCVQALRNPEGVKERLDTAQAALFPACSSSWQPVTADPKPANVS